MATKPVLLLPPAYIEDATKSIQKAKKRISFLCMMVTDDAATNQLIDALNEAAKRGVQVEVAADVFTYGELSGHFIPTRYFTKKSRALTAMGKRFEESHANFHWLGSFSSTPFTGRTHIKWCVVDDTIYSFGGVNLYEDAIRNNDYMFKVTDPALAMVLDDEFDRLVRADKGGFSYRSRSLPSSIGTVHIDGGLPLDSIIYRRICTLTRDASSVLYVSQYGPTGRLNRLLKKVGAKLYFNTGEGATPLNRAVLRFTHFITGTRTLYTRKPYLHAKFMIFTMPGGNKIAMTGSHNFVHGGVILGTREIALETENPAVIAQLENFFHDHVA